MQGEDRKTDQFYMEMEAVSKQILNLPDNLSTPLHKYGCIRAPLHPLQLRCTPSPYATVRLSRAPRRHGASTLSIRHRIYEKEYLVPKALRTQPRERIALTVLSASSLVFTLPSNISSSNADKISLN
jgi:hypothetical protein